MKKIFFTNIPKRCELLKSKIQDVTITKIYSELKFIYFPFPTLNKTANDDENNAFIDQIETFLLKFFINFRFFTFYISNIDDPTKQSLTNFGPTYFEGRNYLDFNPKSYSQIVNVIITCEKTCLIIEKIPISILLQLIETLKILGISIINITDDPNKVEIKEEITSFCDQIMSNDNDFVKLTIPSISCYYIRRFFYPTFFFNDPSFLKSNEYEIKIGLEDIFYNLFISETYFYSLMKEFTNIMKLLNQEEHEKINIQDFQSKDFIKLRLLNGDEKKLIHLAFHMKDLRIYMMKTIIKQDSKEEEFCKKISHRCCRKFYGFLKNNNNKIIGFIYKFMSNGTLNEFLQKQSIDSTYIIMTIIRLLQGIDYFHSNSLVHRDLKPSNILIDNDFVPYISDFDVMRHADNEPMTTDIGSSSYTSPEQDSGRNYSYSTDIYSFGLIIYFLYEKKNLLDYWNKSNKDEQIPLISNATKNIQDIFQSCLQFNPEKRMETKEIKTKLINEISSFSYFEDYFIQNGNELKTKIVIQYLIESIYIQIDNEVAVNYYYNNILNFYVPFYLKSEGKYGGVYFTIGEYYYQGRKVSQDYSKAIKFFELSAKYDNSNALVYLGMHYQNGNGVELDYIKAKEYYELAAKSQNPGAFLNLGVLYDRGMGVKQDYQKSKEYFEDSAKLGNSTALYNLGNIYLFGKGVEQDYEKAREYFELAAEQNNKHALNSLGSIYSEGLGVEKNYLKAFEYFESSAKLNNLDAYLKLGSMYENGFGVEQDYEKARKYYEYCAKEKNAESFFHLGKLYYNGFGVGKDYKKAFNFIEISAKEKCNKALLFLGDCYEKGIYVKQDYQKAKEYYELSVKQDNSEAYYKLGLMFQNGLCVKKDYLKAKEYFELSANEENSNAFLSLGILYFEGFGVEKDYVKAKEFFEKSAKLKNSNALFNLGNIYSEGYGVEQNYFKAKEYYELSAKLGNSSALLNLGALYEKGHGVRQDYLKAKEYYELSSEKGNLKATLNLGVLYENGRGVKQNYLKAKEYFEIAAKQNDPNAFLLLGNLYSDGHGVEINYLKAIEYYKLSAEQKESKAFINLGYIYQKGLGVNQDISKALTFYGKAADLGDSGGLLNIGFIYFEKQEYKTAIKYYELAAKQNNSTALLNLGNHYEFGNGVEQNYTKAKEYYELSAKLNNTSAYLYLGNLYEYGNGVDKNYTKAKDYYFKSAKLNDSDALVFLGGLYEKGLGVTQNIFKAIGFYELAVKQNNALAFFRLGNLYSSGEFLDIDLMNAENYFLNCFNAYNNEVITYSPAESSYCVFTSYNFYRYLSLNDLGLLYLTILQDEKRAFKFIKESAYAEYPFAQNNLGLYYQLHLDETEKAEHFYKRSSENNFALADFNLGQMKEKENKMQESIEHFIKASSHEDQPLLYQFHHHHDKRLEISKTFILCFTNLKIALSFFNDSKFDESKKYFVKSFAKLNLVNDKITYKFEFHFNKRKRKNIFSYFMSFILFHPLFNLKNQPYSQIIDFINGLHLNDEDENDENDNKQQNKNIYQNEKIKEFESKSKNCENIESMNAELDNDEDDEIIFDNPGKLFDFIVKKENLIKSFIEENKKIIQIIEELLYISPYPILFGRISIQEPKQKQIKQINHLMKNIDESFSDGFGDCF